MRAKARNVIAMILLWASFITFLIGTFWYNVFKIMPEIFSSGILKDQLICGFFIVAGIAATIHWVAMVFGVDRNIKNILESERDRRDHPELYRY